jgi:nucleotide-binding universal stress UspA family protein
MNNHPFKQILLATEHTEFDIGAERLAFAMARRCGVPLRVVIPVLSNPEYEIQAHELSEQADEEIARKISNLRAQAAESNVELDIHIRHGEEASDEIVAEAKIAHTDLIIIRRRGNPGFLANMLVGEMVSRVIRDAPCNVLMVPRAAQFWQHQILAAVGDDAAAPHITELAAVIAEQCTLPLTITSIAENSTTQIKVGNLNIQCVANASTRCKQVKGRVLIGKPVEQTIALAQEISADLLIIGRQRYSLIPFLHGNNSIMQKIAGAMLVPTLIVHH